MSVKKIVLIVIVLIYECLAGSFVCRCLPWILSDKESYNENLEYFNALCGYIEENREAFEEFSESQQKLLDNETDVINIERTGDNQELRDIVMRYADDAAAWKNDDDNTVVSYHRGTFGDYEYYIKYQQGIALGQEESETHKYVGDDIEVYTYRIYGD